MGNKNVFLYVHEKPSKWNEVNETNAGAQRNHEENCVKCGFCECEQMSAEIIKER